MTTIEEIKNTLVGKRLKVITMDSVGNSHKREYIIDSVDYKGCNFALNNSDGHCCDVFSLKDASSLVKEGFYTYLAAYGGISYKLVTENN